jgi:hypothetical protein
MSETAMTYDPSIPAFWEVLVVLGPGFLKASSRLAAAFLKALEWLH